MIAQRFQQRHPRLKIQLQSFAIHLHVADVDKAFAAASVVATARAEELAIDQWIVLANSLQSKT